MTIDEAKLLKIGDKVVIKEHTPEVVESFANCYISNRIAEYPAGRICIVTQRLEIAGNNEQCVKLGCWWVSIKAINPCDPAPTPGINPKDLLGMKKVPLDLLPPVALAHCAMAMLDGASKYGKWNWRDNKVLATIYIAAAMRHILDYLDGEDLAGDSKCHHLGHAMACCAIVLDAQSTDCLVDDRRKSGKLPALLKQMQKQIEGQNEH